MYTRTHTGDEPYLKDIHNAHVTHWKVNYSDDVLHVPLVSSSQWQGTPVVSPAIVPGAFMAQGTVVTSPPQVHTTDAAMHANAQQFADPFRRQIVVVGL